jgi:diadenosine tetraphosphatase ApaH/serine/threonine PP2A family protein phosphatase
MMMGKSREGVRQEVIDVIEWTRKQLAEDDIEFLEGLGEQVHVDERILIVHGSPRDGDEYILSTDAIRENVEMLGQTQPEVRVCFFGHSHFPMVIGLPEIHTRFHETRTIELDPNRLYLINPGSVGQPRDGCSKCAFGLYDSEKSTITIFREEYDMETTQDKILEAGLDPKLAARLQLGK